MSSKQKQSPGETATAAHATHGAVARGVAGTSSVAGMADRVWFSCGLTLNLGNYESARVDAGMATDVRPGESLMDALLRCKDFVTHEIEGQSVDVRNSLHAKTGEPQPAAPKFGGGDRGNRKKRSY